MSDAPPIAPKPGGRLIVTASDPLFTVAVDPSRRHLHFVMNGLWDARTGAAFGAAAGSAIEKLVAAGAPFGSLRTLVDARTAAVMPQHIIANMQALAQSQGPASERVAMLLGGMLQKMQFQRTVHDPNFQIFFDEDAAIEWLFAD
ncbi:hypothetical protein [Sphingomonas sp.]|uniref:hypothetical protein n=1 Tax=Sphingomonas sp. TaxID=28214 RepID=UPI003CC5580F